MATRKKLLYNGYEVLVDCAKRDGSGNEITTTYVTTADLDSKLNSYVTTNSLTTTLSNYWSKSNLFTKGATGGDSNQGYQTYMTANIDSSNEEYVELRFDSTYFFPYDSNQNVAMLPINFKKIKVGDENKSLIGTEVIDVDAAIDSKVGSGGYGIPKLIPIFRKQISNKYFETFTYTYWLSQTNTLAFAFNADALAFRLSHEIDDEDDWIITMFQRKKKNSYNRKGTKFSHLGSYSSSYRYLYDYYKYNNNNAHWNDNENLPSSTKELFKTEWKLSDMKDGAIYALDGYIPAVLIKRRVNSYTYIPTFQNGSEYSRHSTTYKNYKSPEIAFALCKVVDGKLIQGPLTIIKVGIYYLQRSNVVNVKFRLIS